MPLEELAIGAGRQGIIYHHRERDTPALMNGHGHRHRELEVNLVLAGTGRYVMAGRTVDLAADSLLWLWPSEGHLLLPASADFEMLIAVWRPGLVTGAVDNDAGAREVVDLEHRPPAASLARTLAEPTAASLAGLMLRLKSDAALEPGHHSAGMRWLLRECWSAFCAADDVPAGSRLHPAVERAARWLADHAHEEAAEDLDTLAERVGLSRWRLSRLFARQVGRTLVEYRQMRRLEHARRLLGRAGRDGTPGRLSLTQVALHSGFGSYAQFYRTWRRHLGTSPAGRR